MSQNLSEMEQFLVAAERDHGLGPAERERLTALWPAAENAAQDCAQRMPSIGLLSFSRRIRAFIAVCRVLDSYQDTGTLDDEQAQLALTILRLRNRAYRKAEAMFVARASRLTLQDKIALPRTASNFLLAVNHL